MPPSILLPNITGLYIWPWQLIAHALSACQFWSLYAFPFDRYDTLSVSIAMSLVTLTFDILTLKLVHIIVRSMSNQFTNFAAWEFSFSTYGPTTFRRTTWPRHHDLGLWTSWHCPWCGSSCSSCVQSLKFVLRRPSNSADMTHFRFQH